MKWHLKFLFVLSLTFAAAPQAFADESDCTGILKQDIRDRLVVINNASNRQVSASSLCDSQSGSSSSGFSVQYAGIGVGENSADAFAKAYCSKGMSESDIRGNSELYQSVIDPTIVQASLACFAANTKGLHYAIHSDSDTHSVTLEVTYTGPTGVSVTGVDLNGNISCEGELWKETSNLHNKNVQIDTRNRSMTCIPKTEVNNSTDDIPAGSAVITTTGGNIYLQIPRRFSPSLEKRFDQLTAKVAALENSLQTQQGYLSDYVISISGRVGPGNLDTQRVLYSKPVPVGYKLLAIVGRFADEHPQHEIVLDAVSPDNKGFTLVLNDHFGAGHVKGYNTQDMSVDYTAFFVRDLKNP
ncbi:hypothetical protein PH547_04155 [Rhizobium sp. CNPSo 3464]|uniref:hypothetical protein n=1 Tax=Rhizobium sp. CNPSo 3464 TaxID=3021406 RepID=UPI00254A48F4|nr:hypothetical protein [Rhizobium sp. CNPSo 3464]MDK4738058.1 hypothetical protein [Rhizobium sp. CNPSo 3464]